MKLLHDKRFYRFLLPSLVGAFLFVTPIMQDGNLTIPIAVAANGLLDLMGEGSLTVIWLLICISTVVTVIHRLHPLALLKKNPKLDNLFSAKGECAENYFFLLPVKQSCPFLVYRRNRTCFPCVEGVIIICADELLCSVDSLFPAEEHIAGCIF